MERSVPLAGGTGAGRVLRCPVPRAWQPHSQVVALGKEPALVLQYRGLSLGVWGTWRGRVCSPL